MLLNSVMIKNMNIPRLSQIHSLLIFSLDMEQDVMGLEPSKLRHLSYVIAAFSRCYYEYSFGVGVLVRIWKNKARLIENMINLAWKYFWEIKYALNIKSWFAIILKGVKMICHIHKLWRSNWQNFCEFGVYICNCFFSFLFRYIRLLVKIIFFGCVFILINFLGGRLVVSMAFPLKVWGHGTGFSI